jgi:hypothetical protein
MPAETLELVRRRAIPQDFDDDEASCDCPACGSPGVACGTRNVEWDYEHLIHGSHHPSGTMWFEADRFICRVCGLQLNSTAELKSAGMGDRWEEDFNPLEYVPEIDEDVAYEAWRNRQGGRIG